MKYLRLISAIVSVGLAFLFFSTAASAQDEGGQRFADDAVYYEVEFVDYKPGKTGEAYGIIAEHFSPAGEAAGLPGPTVFHFQSGPWDAAFNWQQKNGLADLEWRISPDNAKFFAALSEQEGGEEAAQAVIDRYNEMIARTEVYIGHTHTVGEVHTTIIRTIAGVQTRRLELPIAAQKDKTDDRGRIGDVDGKASPA